MTYPVQIIEKKMSRFQKKTLLYRPTPVSKLDGLSSYLNGPNIWIKREDLTGLALGGNKSRKLEYIIQDVIDCRADAVITWGSIQSNWCLQTAAAARKYGIKPTLLLFETYETQKEMDGNLLLDFILDADIRVNTAQKGRVVKAEQVEGIMEEVFNEVEEQGHKAYTIPIGGSMTGGSMKLPLGAIAYVDAYLELKKQVKSINKSLDSIVLASGSGGTQAGLLAGARLCGDSTQILGISVSEDSASFSQEIKKISDDVVNCLGLKVDFRDKDIVVFDDYRAGGYGELNEEVVESIRLMAVTEGVFIDPIYTGKAVAALIDLIHKGHFKKEDNVLFLHTGGASALFPHKQGITKFLLRDEKSGTG
jgi:L-cysteate sulfo-lyase